MVVAAVRGVSRAINRCELTHMDRLAIDVPSALEQHNRYVEALAELGCSVESLPADDNLPDSVFIEDTAVVVDEVAVITRPGAASRRGETPATEELLKRYRPIRRIQAPGTLDGGDVLTVGRTLFVGASGRSNGAGIEQLRAAVCEFGYDVVAVEVRGCLHLKSAVTQVADGTLLVNSGWLPGIRHDAARGFSHPFTQFELIEIDPSEPMAANALLVGSTVIYPAAFPRTRERIELRAVKTRTIDVSELAKAEGAVTCCSVLLNVP